MLLLVRAFFLYGDGCIPTDGPEEWNAYSQRLLELASPKFQSRYRRKS